jgi:hypothetical protein
VFRLPSEANSRSSSSRRSARSLTPSSPVLLLPVPTHPFTNIVVRADTATNTTLPGGAVIPAACDSTCSATLVTYGYCLEADNRCLDICTDANYDAFVSCANCAFMVRQGKACHLCRLVRPLTCFAPVLYILC